MPLTFWIRSETSGVLTIADGATASRSLSFTSLGMWCRLKTVNISLFGLSCTFPDDLDLLLVGPDGTNLLFWSDAGGTHELFSQSFAMGDFGPSLPDSGGVTSGSYRPADYGSVETSSNWAGLPPGLVINHAAPNGAAAFDASFAGKWFDDTT